MTVDDLSPVDLAQVDLRVADPRLLPFDTPQPNMATTWEGRDVLWLGPDEWLLVGEPAAEGRIVRQLEEATSGTHHSVVDVGANRTVFDLTDSLDQLSSGCGLDIDPTRWQPGMCAQTLFGKSQVILHQLDERTTRVFVRPSFADYFLERLEAAQPIR